MSDNFSASKSSDLQSQPIKHKSKHKSTRGIKIPFWEENFKRNLRFVLLTVSNFLRENAEKISVDGGAKMRRKKM